MLGVAGNTETGACWPLSKAHNPSGIVPGIEVRVRRTERAAWRQEAASPGRGEGVFIYVDSEFSPFLSLSVNTGKGPNYGLSVLPQPALCILRPCWVLGEPAESPCL